METGVKPVLFTSIRGNDEDFSINNSQAIKAFKQKFYGIQAKSSQLN